MRLRRVSTAELFWASLRTNECDVLPLWFADSEQAWVARTIEPELATLAEGAELQFPAIRVSCGSDDVVLAAASGSESLLAARYAALTRRRLVLAERESLREAFFGPAPRSVTWFCSLDETDLAGALVHVSAALGAQLGSVPRLGVLTAESAAKLSWVLAKQLLPEREDVRTSATTLICSGRTEAVRWSSIEYFDSTRTARDILSGFDRADGTLLLHSHSRPHCGLLQASDAVVGVCGLASGGAGGQCVDGSSCHFGAAPRAVLQRSQAQRIYYNGCTTAGVASRRTDFLPRAAMICHAALRGKAREFVGNVRTGYYGETDLQWFIGCSALGRTPAECVSIVEAWRTSTGNETFPSCLYFGDASNLAWPMQGACVGEARPDGDGGLHLHWARCDDVLVARVPDPRWAELAAADRLHVRTAHASRPAVAVVADPWERASLILVVPPLGRAGWASAEPVDIEFHSLEVPVDREVGGALTRAIEHLRWIEALPAFKDRLADGSRQLEDELVAFRRLAASRDDLTMLPETLDCLREMEIEAASRFDALVVDEALSRSRTRWTWNGEYEPSVRALPRKDGSVCPNCGGFAADVDLLCYANDRLKRASRICAYCGIVSDVPSWSLGVTLVPETLVVSSGAVSGRIDLSNGAARAALVSVGVTVRGAGEMRPGSADRARLLVEAGATRSFSFALEPAKALTELMQLVVFAASEGALGMVGCILLFRADRPRPAGRL